jgi:hypothetical protein
MANLFMMVSCLGPSSLVIDGTLRTLVWIKCPAGTPRYPASGSNG